MIPKAKDRPRFGRGAIYTKTATTNAEKLIYDLTFHEARRLGLKPDGNSAFRLEVHSFFLKPASNKKPFHTQKPDFDNLSKIIDALNPSRRKQGEGWKKPPVIWMDDCQIIDGRSVKHWLTPGYVPGISSSGVLILIEKVANNEVLIPRFGWPPSW